MRLLRKIRPEAPLRVGLAATFIYSGLGLIRHPESWVWALKPLLSMLPENLYIFVSETIGVERLLQLQGGMELIFAIVLLAWFIPKKTMRIFALFISLEFAVILGVSGLNDITFRDLGLLGAALSLLVIFHRR